MHLIGVGTTAGTSLLAMLFCLINFSYLYKKPSGDVYHALPVSRTKLLLARFFASILPALAPALLSYVSLTCIGMIDRVELNVGVLWTHAALNLGILLVMAAMTMIFLVCAGNMFSFFASILGLNVGIPIILYIGIALCGNYLYGFKESYTAMYYCTPAFYAFSRYMSFGVENPCRTVLLQLPWLVLIAVVCLLAALLLYNNRKSEKSGETYAFRFVYYLVSVLLSFIGAFVIGYILGDGDFDLSFWVFGLIGGILTAIAFGAVTDKGFKTVKRSAILGACAYVAMLAFTLTIILDITGYENKIPAATDVREVTVTQNYNNLGDITLTDADEVIALHEAILEQEHDDNYLYIGRVDICYQLNSGSTLTRRYTIETEKAAKAYYQLCMNKEYQQAHIDAFNVLSMWGSNYSISYYDAEGGDSLSASQLTAEHMEKVLTLYFADLANTDYTSLNRDKSENYYLYAQAGVLQGDHIEYKSLSMDLPVDDRMPNVKAYLDSLLSSEQTADTAVA